MVWNLHGGPRPTNTNLILAYFFFLLLRILPFSVLIVKTDSFLGFFLNSESLLPLESPCPPRTDGKFTPLCYRTSSPSGPLPKKDGSAGDSSGSSGGERSVISSFITLTQKIWYANF